MNLLFIANNLHFSLSVLGSLTFLTAAWLIADAAYFTKTDWITLRRGIGFALLAIWQLLHAFNLTDALIVYAGYLIYTVGLALILWGYILEKPLAAPKFQAVLLLPAVGMFLVPANLIGAVGYGLIAWLTFRQYKKEFKKSNKNLWIGFLLLSLSAICGAVYRDNTLNIIWAVGHIFEAAGFISLSIWSGQFIRLRLKEELVLIFVTMGLGIATVVTLAFSTILITRVEKETKDNLLINARVLDFAIERLKQQSLAQVKYLAGRSDVRKAMQESNGTELSRLLGASLEAEQLGFVMALNGDGEVIVRAHSPVAKGDNASSEKAVAEALAGQPFVTVEGSEGEGFSVRAAAPLISGGRTFGVVVGGFPLDNAMMDNIKRITGLEMSIFEGAVRSATTEIGADGRTRETGVRVVDERILSEVLKDGKSIVIRTEILSRPFLASYLPIYGVNKEIVGMISSGQPQQEILNIATATNRLTFIAVGILMMLMIVPIYAITKKLIG